MSPVIGIPIGILVALAGAWMVIAVVRRLRTPLGWILLLVTGAALFEGGSYIKRHVYPQNKYGAHNIVERSTAGPTP